MKNILVVSGHTNINNSLVNKTILKELSDKFENLEITKLDLLYPDYKIDVKAEQDKLVKADVILLQYPVFWYGMPSIMQKWIEDVFVYGFAYGSTGGALKDKRLVVSMTFGGSKESYSKDSPISEEDIFLVAKGLCSACGMKFSGYESLFGMSYAHLDENSRKEIIKKASEYSLKVCELINKA